MNHKLALRFVDDGMCVLHSGRPLVGDTLGNYEAGSAFLIAGSKERNSKDGRRDAAPTKQEAKKKTSKKSASKKKTADGV